MIDTTRLIKAAKVWHDAGCSVVPANADGTKRPFGPWKQYQSERATHEQLEQWLGSGEYDGFGIVCGAISGNLEMFEIEGRAADDGLYDRLGMAMLEHGYADLWARLCLGYLEKTPSGGFHWLLRVPTPRPNLKLARRPSSPVELAQDANDRVKVLIETRGEGGFTIVAPSGGRTHPDGTDWERLEGRPSTIAVVTDEERDALHAIASTFDLMPPDEPVAPRTPREPGEGLRPGDDFNLRATWDEILIPHGWSRAGNLGSTLTWCRPGKSLGISATTGRNDGDNLYVFSSSTPFETEKPYSKFAAYALLDHGGDFPAAARALAKAGYGDRTGERKADPLTAALDAAETAQADEPVTPAASVTSTEVVTVPDVAEFWQARPVLEHIRLFARARLCSPWAVLGVVLARVVTATPPYVVLPGLVGSYGSVNLFVALVGPSGGGKGASESAAADCIDMGEIETATVGSGEGIGHLYAHREKGEVVRDRDAVLFTIPEVDNLTALAGRQGATLLPQLRSAWSGERLGFAYADKNKALPILRHSYRMGLVLGVQPGRAGTLLDDADGGTPQRFLWMPTSDRDAPDQTPECPAPMSWTLPAPWVKDVFGGLAELPIPDVARQTIGINRLSRLRGEGEALDGHALLTRLKAAAALALLDERQGVNEQDWELAGQIMTVSDATRASVVEYLAGKSREANRAKGEAEGSRAVLVADRVAEANAKRVARKVVGHLSARGGEMGRRDLRVKIAHRDRPYFDDAVERLQEAGIATVEGVSAGELIKLVS